MKPEIDVLILFADADDKAEGTHQGWVTQFRKFLSLMLTQVLGEKPNILAKGEFDTITAPNLDNVATVVPVLSEHFIQSGTCLDNLETFYKVTERQTSATSRVFKVFKKPLAMTEQPPRLRDLIGYEMYQLDPDSGEINEYSDFFSSEAERHYWMKLVDLAYDINDSLMQLRGTTSPMEPKGIYNRKTIYLAETGHDLSVQRNIIRRELQRHGYQVLPNHNLPGTAAELERVVARELDQSDLSIHLIGAAYGEIPEGGDRSYLDVQNSLAAAKSQQARQESGDFPRLIWISPSLMNASERQKAFIEKLKRDTESQEGAEILQTPLEDFKNIMREELLDHGSKTAHDTQTGRSVYLMYDRVDNDSVKPILASIERAGYHVFTPPQQGDLLTLRKEHIDHLRNFDIAIVFQNRVNDQWVRMKMLDLLKAPGFGRKKKIMGKAILTPAAADHFKQPELRVLGYDPERIEETLSNYLREFKD
jgi:hypothetical protein